MRHKHISRKSKSSNAGRLFILYGCIFLLLVVGIASYFSFPKAFLSPPSDRVEVYNLQVNSNLFSSHSIESMIVPSADRITIIVSNLTSSQREMVASAFSEQGLDVESYSGNIIQVNSEGKSGRLMFSAEGIEFLPNNQRYIVEFASQSVLGQAKVASESSEQRRNFGEVKVQDLLREGVLRDSLIAYENQIEAEQESALRGIPSNKIVKRYTKTFNGAVLENVSLADINKLRKSGEVKRVYVDRKVKASLFNSVPAIHVPEVWAQGYTGKNVKVAVIDTGVDYTHPDLGGCFGTECKVVAGYDFVNGDSNPMDDNGHGTHVAATIAGRGVLSSVALDVDGNGLAEADTDGKLISGVLFGLSDSALTNHMGAGAIRSLSETTSYIGQLRSNCALDADGNGQSDALTDGVLIVRYLNSSYSRDDAFATGALGTGATRTTFSQIGGFLSSLESGTNYCSAVVYDYDTFSLNRVGDNDITLTIGSRTINIIHDTNLEISKASPILADADGKVIHTKEGEKVLRGEYFVLGSGLENGGVFKVDRIFNSSTPGSSGDGVSFTNMLTSESVDAIIGANDGQAILTYQGVSYYVHYNGSVLDESNYIEVTFGAGADYGFVGNEQTNVTGIKLANGGHVSFASAGDLKKTYNLPDSVISVGESAIPAIVGVSVEGGKVYIPIPSSEQNSLSMGEPYFFGDGSSSCHIVSSVLKICNDTSGNIVESTLGAGGIASSLVKLVYSSTSPSGGGGGGRVGTTSITSVQSYPLFTASEKINLGDDIGKVRSSIVEADMSELLKRGIISGTDIEAVQSILIGSNAVFYNTSSQAVGQDIEHIALPLSTSASIYNLSIAFSRPVNFKELTGESIVIFGKKYYISSETSDDRLVLDPLVGRKLIFISGTSVFSGDYQSVDGTYVNITGGVLSATKLMIRVVAPDSDHDNILAGNSFIDPVFGTFDVYFQRVSYTPNLNAEVYLRTILYSDLNALKGVAPDAKIYAYKVLDREGSGDSSGIIAAIERAVDPNDDGNFADHVDIISMSLGGGGDPDDPMSTAIDSAVNSGVLAVIAAGNSGPWAETIGSPGTARKALTVGAADAKNIPPTIARFSSRGPVTWAGGIIFKPDVVAPGVHICAATDRLVDDHGIDIADQLRCIDNRHVSISGTSMATPHVSGIAALIKEKYPNITPEDLKSVIRSTTDDLGQGYSINDQGLGMVNAKSAINISIIISEQIEYGELQRGVTNMIRPLRIRNVKDYPVSLQISAGSAVSVERDSVNPLTFSESSVTLNVGEEKIINVTLDLPIAHEGAYLGMITITEGNRNYRLPYTFSRFSTLNLSMAGERYPTFVLHREQGDFYRSASQGWNFVGNKAEFRIIAGTYYIYALSDFVNDENPIDYPEKDEYLLVDRIVVPASSNLAYEFNINDAKKITVKARAKDDSQLFLNEWNSALVVYNETDKLLSTSRHSASSGDREIYVSKRPAGPLHVDFMAKYVGTKI